jgi:ribonuclease R
LAANVCSADYIAQSKHAGLFRVHEGPTPEKQETLRNYLKATGIPLTIGDDPKPGEFQAIALATKDRPDALQIHTMLLRSMSQAIYTPSNSGHFGLAYDAYTHFTSPIRRYPDLLVHRVIKAVLTNSKYKLPTLPTPGEAQDKLAKRLASRVKAPTNKLEKAVAPTKEIMAWQAAGLHCSANERRADEASRDVEAWLKCKYMREYLGEEFDGVVSSVTSFGLFITLDAMFVEGLIHITELGGEYFKFDEARQELRGERTGIKYAIGTRVRVQVSKVDLDARKIDFRFVPKGDDLLARAMKDKGFTSGNEKSASYGAPRSDRSKASHSNSGGGSGKAPKSAIADRKSKAKKSSKSASAISKTGLSSLSGPGPMTKSSAKVAAKKENNAGAFKKKMKSRR